MGKYHNELDMSLENSCYTKIIKQVPECSDVLEFGPAEGLVTRYLSQEKGCRVFIVEIDEASYEKARRYSEKGILGDIEEYAWEREFRDVAFDCIIFSDVLEHLRNPLEVLKRTKALLKADGMVLTSIPNIAHNDILLKLCDDRFDYTNIGLLDSTHVHFFAYHNVCEIFAASGYVIVKEDWVESKTFHTEQATKEERAGAYLRESFYQRPCGEIYQFIMTAQKREYVEAHHEEPKALIRERIENTSLENIPDYPLLLQDKDELIEQKENYIVEQREQLSQRDRQILALNGVIENKENYIVEQREMLSQRDRKILELNGVIGNKENYIGEQREQLSQRDRQILALNGVIENKENYIVEQREMLSQRDREIFAQNGVIEQKENYIVEQRERLSEKDREILELNGVIGNKENYIVEQREMLSERDRKIIELNGIVEQKENYIGEQREQLNEKAGRLDRLGAAVRDALSGTENTDIPETDYLCGFLNRGIVRTLFRSYVKLRRRKEHAD